MSELIVRSKGSALEGGILRNGRLTDYLPADDGGTGRIYLARIARIDPDLKAARVDLGDGGEGWLDLRKDLARAGTRLHEGAAAIVQVARPATAGKGPRVTTDVVLADIGETLRPCRAVAPASAGSERLRALWGAIERRAADAAPPALLHRPDPILGLLRAARALGVAAVTADDHLAMLKIRGVLERHAVPLAVEAQPGVWSAAGLADQLLDALHPEVALDGGGSLLIEPTTALTAIDVNGAGRPALGLDLEAAAAIAHQVRLRRIGGIIVVDFVDLRRRVERERLHHALGRAFEDDPLPVEILPMTRLGLVQMTRQRIGPSLDQLLRRPCPSCAGEGRVLATITTDV
ncbi:MAG TPA: ribonuclease E/G [Geminicoccaceae bacterium]